MIRLDTPTQEDWFAIWLDELVELGYINSYIRGDEVKTFTLTDKVDIPYLKVGKKSTTSKTYSLLKGSTYTPDFEIIWNQTALDVFVDIIEDTRGHPSYFLCSSGDLVSYVDVKSPYVGKNCSDVSFSLNRKVVYEAYDIFINKCVLTPAGKKRATKNHLYHRYGAPERFFYTDKTMMKKAGALKYEKLLAMLDL